MAGVLTGVAWYRKSEWPLLASLATDPEVLPKTYEEWRMLAEQTYARLEHEGYRVEKVEVRLADLIAWCAEHGRPMDESARSAFVADTLRRLDQARARTAPGASAAAEKASTGAAAPGDVRSEPTTS